MRVWFYVFRVFLVGERVIFFFFIFWLLWLEARYGTEIITYVVITYIFVVYGLTVGYGSHVTNSDHIDG